MEQANRLGKLTRVELRDYWKHEALNFTRWLAQPENIDLLSDEVGIEIQVVQTEARVGRFNVDILAEEENTGRKIIIENQLEMTDHSHLGQIITYAAGLSAEYIIWIVRDVREEHEQAVDWLNEHTDEHINFFLVAIELWRIENSVPAPKFTTISRPNEWQRSIRASAQDGEISDTKTRQIEFWQQLKEFASRSRPELKLQKPRPQHWYPVSIGRSDCLVSLTVVARENRVGCELYIPGSKELFHALLACRVQVEKELGLQEVLEWRELPAKKASRILVVRTCQFDDPNAWETVFPWLVDTAVRFKRVFGQDWVSRRSPAMNNEIAADSM